MSANLSLSDGVNWVRSVILNMHRKPAITFFGSFKSYCPMWLYSFDIWRGWVHFDHHVDGMSSISGSSLIMRMSSRGTTTTLVSNCIYENKSPFACKQDRWTMKGLIKLHCNKITSLYKSQSPKLTSTFSNQSSAIYLCLDSVIIHMEHLHRESLQLTNQCWVRQYYKDFILVRSSSSKINFKAKLTSAGWTINDWFYRLLYELLDTD